MIAVGFPMMDQSIVVSLARTLYWLMQVPGYVGGLDPSSAPMQMESSM